MIEFESVDFKVSRPVSGSMGRILPSPPLPISHPPWAEAWVDEGVGGALRVSQLLIRQNMNLFLRLAQ